MTTKSSRPCESNRERSIPEIGCAWGENGLAALGPTSDVIVIVDVFSFSTCAEAAASRAVEILPYAHGSPAVAAFAERHGAAIAGPRKGPGFSLSPHTYLAASPGTRVVLPSRNGAMLTLAASARTVLAACLRNAAAVAGAARDAGVRITVVAAGERWPDGSLRPCLEDWLGAGAILEHLPGRRSPDAEAAIASYRAARDDLGAALAGCHSGHELIDAGYPDDIRYAAEPNVSAHVPIFRAPAYVPLERPGAPVPLPGSSREEYP